MTPDQQAHFILSQGPFVTLWIMLFVCTFLFGPFVFVYCAVRFFRDLRRIAVALEYSKVDPRDMAHAAFLDADKRRQDNPSTVVNSMFGR
jgi:hypothetical protein